MVGENEYSVLYGYTNRRLTSITHNGFNYGFTYDGMGRLNDVKIAGETYSSTHFYVNNITTITTTYATGEKMRVETDKFDRPAKTTYIDENDNATILSETEYDSLGRVTKSIDNTTETEYNYKYDGFGNITECRHGSVIVENSFDSCNRLTINSVQPGDTVIVTEPIFERNSAGKIYPDNAVTGVNLSGFFSVNLTRDSFGRTTEKTINDDFTDSFDYVSVTNGSQKRLTNLVESISQAYGNDENILRYSYDNNGNIVSVTKDNNLIARYSYDGMNQLVREDNAQLSKTYVFEYDTAGNITSKKEYSYTTGTPTTLISTKAYGYSQSGWKDKLVSFDGQSITYDVLGNPLTYLGYTLTWDRVRQIKAFGNNTFDYDAQGRRIRKNSKYYEYENGKLFRSWETPQTLLTYLYDTTGICGIECKRNFVFDPETGFHYDPTTYVFKKNLQGDVIAIYTLNGTKVAEYAYDAWGKCTIISDIDGIGVLNPIRYRGYYYDTETGLYYLNSRYYDPNTGRFINADSQFDDGAGILGNNLYAYCANNPITYKDDRGTAITLACVFVAIGISAVVSFASSVITDVIYGEKISWKNAGISAGFGAVSAGLTLACPSAAVAISATLSAAESVVLGLVNDESPVEYVTDAVISASIGAVTAGWGDDIAEIDYDLALKAAKKSKNGNHPTVKKDAQKTIKKVIKNSLNDVVVSTTETTIFSTLTGGVGKITKQLSYYIY